MKNPCFFGHRFWKDFGKVLGGLWEAKILDFRIFFDVFFDAKFRVQLGRAKNRKKRPQKTFSPFFKLGAAVCAGLGGRI